MNGSQRDYRVMGSSALVAAHKAPTVSVIDFAQAQRTFAQAEQLYEPAISDILYSKVMRFIDTTQRLFYQAVDFVRTSDIAADIKKHDLSGYGYREKPSLFTNVGAAAVYVLIVAGALIAIL